MNKDSNERLERLQDDLENWRPSPGQALGETYQILEMRSKLEEVICGIEGGKRRLNDLEEKADILFRRTTPHRMNWIYLVAIGLVVAFVAALVSKGWAQTPSVSIEFNVGDIIGGVLVGIAALFAAHSYTYSVSRGSR